MLINHHRHGQISTGIIMLSQHIINFPKAAKAYMQSHLLVQPHIHPSENTNKPWLNHVLTKETRTIDNHSLNGITRNNWQLTVKQRMFQQAWILPSCIDIVKILMPISQGVCFANAWYNQVLQGCRSQEVCLHLCINVGSSLKTRYNLCFPTRGSRMG